MCNVNKLDWRPTLQQGAIAGFISLNLAAIGMVEHFGERFLIAGLITLGQVAFLAAPVAFSYLMARSTTGPGRVLGSLLKSLVIAVVGSLFLFLLIWASQAFDVRSVLPNVSPSLVSILTFGAGAGTGYLVLLGVMVVSCLTVASTTFLPENIRKAIFFGFGLTALVGMLSPNLLERIRNFFGQATVRVLFQSNALQLWPGIILAVSGTVLFYLYVRFVPSRPKTVTKTKTNLTSKLLRQAPLFIILMSLPFFLGTYLTEVTNNVGIFLLMGLGLNIVVGLAGLLDLGYVAFFAIGAYMMGVLTSTGDLGLGLSFWVALPICVAVAAFAGIVLGIPVLKMRGDYLAIVTLGFGEIIRLLALSDLLKPYIGGAQGILNIPKPSLGGFILDDPERLYFVILAGVLLAAFISNRLRESRIGRSWIAVREDEDVAEAMGINLVRTKLLAFAIGAGFSGLAGAIFAPKLTSIFPHSFNFLISLNVLSLIIVGGLGSIPGTVVGAIILVGLPEMLREFAEFRWLIYGALLVLMMLNRPEGFIPSDIMRRELHAGDTDNPQPAS
jgi:branched-chain amino acid transport system permease protein